ncbi:hypothetical protein GCM10023353_30990 [Tomitella cavernea]|uniref:Uncharacterized protein n=1 Tax=Tomitella cavernea TaxID=1387982 RepID=A0ABP9CZC8_9ACTN
MAVATIRSTTSGAVSAGKRERMSAARPATSGAAKLVPSTAVTPRSVRTRSARPPSALLARDTTPVPGAATVTHGPATLNSEGDPSGSTDATVSTWSV